MYKKRTYNIRWHTREGNILKRVTGYELPGRYKGLWLFIYKNECNQWIPSELTTGMALQGISGGTIKEAVSKVNAMLEDKDYNKINEARDWQIKTYGNAN